MQRQNTDNSDALSDQTLDLDETPRPQHQPNGSAPDVAVTSDEENDIIKEIRDEIKRKVREDIKEELAKYDLNNLNSRTESVASSRDAGEGGLPGMMESLLPERDVKYQEAYQKMLKLDKILRKRMAREREVKRDRAMLEKRIKEELEQLRAAATSRRSNDEVNNTMKFLALTHSGDSGAADTGLNDEYSEPHEPVFPTEYLFEEAAAAGTEAASATDRSSRGADAGSSQQQQQKSKRKLRGQKAAAAAAAADGSKDFIKRNIELAAASNDVVAMTPQERERLDALLKDLDSIPELPEEFLESSGGASNPYQLALPPGSGYRMSDEESRRLRDIEAGLARLGSVPPPAPMFLNSARRDSEPEESSVGGLSAGYRQTALQRMQAGLDWDLDRLGEKALAEVKEERMMSHRLDEVNSRLALLGNESSQGPLSAEQMSALLSDCTRSIGQSQQSTYRGLNSAASTSHAAAGALSVNGDAVSEAAQGNLSARPEEDIDSEEMPAGDAQTMQIPPLDRAILDRLLAEARAAGIGQNWIRPEPITEEEEGEGLEEEEDDEAENGELAERPGMLDSSGSSDDDDSERLVLPDISLYANMSAPKTPTSGRYSAT